MQTFPKEVPALSGRSVSSQPWKYLSACLLLLVCLLTATTANAQFSASVSGTVQDDTGAVIPGATLTLTNLGTNQQSVQKSNESGFYRFPSLPPATYKLSVTAANFKQSSFDSVIVSADAPKAIDVKLQPGGATENVTVSADDQSALQTADASVGGTITQESIERLPSVGRDPYNLVRLAPGISGDGARSGSGQASGLPNNSGPGGSNSSIFQTENQVQISSAGQRVSSNTYLIDGVTVDSLGYGGAAVVTPNSEAVREISVVTSSYTAEDGRNSGAQIRVTTKNGTNQFHGSALFKYDSPNFNAFNRFNGVASGGTIAPPQRVQDSYRDWAGSLGGPIIKDKLFFFLSYEGIKNYSSSQSQQYLATPQLFATLAKAPGVTGSFFSQPGFTPRTLAVLPFACSDINLGADQCQTVTGGLDLGSPTGAPSTYTTAVGGGLDGIPDVEYATVTSPSRTRGNQFNGRIDFNLTPRDLIAGSAYFTKLDITSADASTGSAPNADLSFKPLNSAVTLIYIHTFTPTLLNEARANLTRFAENGIADNTNVNFGIPRLQVEGYPIPNRPTFGASQGETTPAIFAQNTYEVRDTVSKSFGSHNVRTGVEIRFEQDNSNYAGAARPIYSNVGFWNLYNGAPVYEGIDADPATGGNPQTRRYFRTQDYAGFIQDDWKVTPYLTVNVGLRYEYFTPLKEKNNTLANIQNPLQTTIDTGAKIVPVNKFYGDNTKNLAPKFGFAYTPPMFNGKTVVRGGFGMSFNRIDDVLFSNSRANSGYFRYGICCGFPDSPFAYNPANPNGNLITYVGGTSSSPFSYPVNPTLKQPINPLTGTPTGSQVEIYGAFGRTPNPYSYLFSLEVQHQLPFKLVTTIGYQGSTSLHYTRLVNECLVVGCNPPVGSTTARLFSGVYVPTNDVSGNYHGVNAHLSRRFSRGFQFDANYTYSKSMDQLSSEGPGAQTNQTNPANNRTEYGPSDYDNTHRYYVNGIWDIPWLFSQKGLLETLFGHFQLNGIVTGHTGFPWTPVVGFANSASSVTDAISPSRPIALLHKPGTDYSNEAFRTGKNFINPDTGKVDGSYYFSTEQPTGPGAYTPGVGRNSLRGPRYFDVDLSVAKEFPFEVQEHTISLNLRANAFNTFNTEQIAPFGFNTDSTNIQNGRFGQGTSGLAGRVFEVQGRLTF